MDKIDNFNLDESYQQKSDEEYISGDDYREQLQNLQPKQAPSFSWQQKLASAFLVVFGVSALILWAVQFKGGLQITKPLTAEELAQLNQSKNPEAAALDSLRNQDTDQDGLSDYDELYAYNTSPYLEDSDSDGILDKKEALRIAGELIEDGLIGEQGIIYRKYEPLKTEIRIMTSYYLHYDGNH